MTVATFAAHASVPTAKLDDARRILEAGLRLGPTLVAYSGGKDALVAAHLAREAGVTVNVCDVSYNFTKQTEDIRYTAALHGFAVVYREVLDLAWLARHPKYVFTRQLMHRSELCQFRQRDSVEDWARAHGFHVVVTGRKKHGNSVRWAVHPRGSGTVGCHPLREWDDGDIWAYLRDAGIAVPWVYGTEFGRYRGNSAWPFCRQYPDLARNYGVIHAQEAALVHAAAEAGVIGAAEYVASRRAA